MIGRIAERVRDAAGLVFSEFRARDVESAVRRIMARRGHAREEDVLSAIGQDTLLLEELVAELTVGETYFQRDAEQMELLKQRILPELLESRPADHRVRVWSAGCASGEEPYSVAMLFDELRALERAEIIGTDIARHRLEHARRGVYSAWSLRSTPERLRRRYFTARGRYWELDARVRRPVDFQYLNLAEDSFPSLSTAIWGMDVILCRNVLIYFDRETITLVARRLIETLSVDGWLVMGASDPAISEVVDCDVVTTDAGLVYRRPGAARGTDLRTSPGPIMEAARPEDWGRPASVERAEAYYVTQVELVGADFSLGSHPEDPAAEAARPAAAREAERAESSSVISAYLERDFDAVRQRAASAAELTEAEWVAWVRAAANQGAADEAMAVARRAVEARGPTAELLYLQAVLMLQAGQVDAAERMARQALYYDRRLVVAHLTLAEAQRRLGRAEQARRSLRNAGALITELPADAVVPMSDGEFAGRLGELVRVKLRLLGAGE